MWRIGVVCLGVVSTLCIEAARAEDAREPVETSDVTMDASLAEDSDEGDPSSIADAHAQFAPVLSPPTLSLSEGASYGSALAYMGLDGWRYGGSAYVGGEWSPVAQSSFILRAFASDGLDDFKAGTTRFRSETVRASLLPGYQIREGTLDIKLFVGVDYMLRIPLGIAADPPIQLFGVRTSADLWWEPAQSWMVSGSVSATTIERGMTGRLASGWRSSFGWIGPEVLALHDIYTTQLRAGAHLSGFQVGMTEWSVAGGYAQDSFGRTGAYARLGISYRPLP